MAIQELIHRCRLGHRLLVFFSIQEKICNDGVEALASGQLIALVLGRRWRRLENCESGLRLVCRPSPSYFWPSPSYFWPLKHPISVEKLKHFEIPIREVKSREAARRPHANTGPMLKQELGSFDDYTPVCTTELGAFAKLEPDFTKRGVKLIGLSANTLGSHEGWIKDIDEVTGSSVKFPIIADKERKVALAYDMIDHQDATNVDEKGTAFTIRSVFIIDPKKTIRTILSYPASTGRNSAEVLRIVDSLQTGDKHKITTPINWVPGDDVIVH
ncbi:hypothetical protein BN1723_017895, partial [Verticillium longisporum]